MQALRNHTLEMIAKGEPLGSTLETLCVEAERLLSEAICVVVSADAAGRLHALAAPSFPELYRNALDGIVIGPDIGSCGSAIYRNMPIIVQDIATDPKWAAFKTLALPLGWNACCSTPIRNEAGGAVGAVGLYFREKRAPTPDEQALIETCVNLCELAMQRQEDVLDRARRATVDALTDLPNRSAFDDALSHLRCELPGSWGLFVVDLDNLKAINETFGRDAGDALIRTMAQRISAAVAPDMTFRTGGNEFISIIQSEQSLYDLHRTAEKISEALSEPVQHNGRTVLPKATIGAAVLSPQDTQPAAVHRNADFALYHAKETVRGGAVRYWAGLETRMAQRRDSIREVMQALADDRIDAHYQPILRLGSGKIVGFEALSRLTNASGRTLPAGLFQEAFSDAHVAAALTDRMISIVASDLRSWLDQGLVPQHIGINVTSADFYMGDLSEKLREACGRYGIPIECLVIEVTENVYIGQRDRVTVSGISSLRTTGVRVALDDFGTGFASLTHLLNVPVDIIKLDQSFIRRLTASDPSAPIVKGLIQIARDLKLQVIAEGIETDEQLSLLRTMGCSLGQGFLFSKAVQRHSALQMLRQHGEGGPDTWPFSVEAALDKRPMLHP